VEKQKRVRSASGARELLIAMCVLLLCCPQNTQPAFASENTSTRHFWHSSTKFTFKKEKYVQYNINVQQFFFGKL